MAEPLKTPVRPAFARNPCQATSQRRANTRARLRKTMVRPLGTSSCGQTCHVGALRQNTFRYPSSAHALNVSSPTLWHRLAHQEARKHAAADRRHDEDDHRRQAGAALACARASPGRARSRRRPWRSRSSSPKKPVKWNGSSLRRAVPHRNMTDQFHADHRSAGSRTAKDRAVHLAPPERNRLQSDTVSVLRQPALRQDRLVQCALVDS